MANRKPLTNEDGEVCELTAEDFAQMVPFAALPPELQKILLEPKTVRPDSDGPARDPAA